MIKFLKTLIHGVCALYALVIMDSWYTPLYFHAESLSVLLKEQYLKEAFQELDSSTLALSIPESVYLFQKSYLTPLVR